MSKRNLPGAQAGVTRRDKTAILEDRVLPKNQKIGMQAESLDENILESQTSLFEDQESPIFMTDKKTGQVISERNDNRRNVKGSVLVDGNSGEYCKTLQGFQGRQGHQKDISNSYSYLLHRSTNSPPKMDSQYSPSASIS